MREPRRLIDQGEGLGASLLRAAANVDAPPPDLLGRTFASVGIAAVAGSAASGSKAATALGAAKKVTTLVLAKWTLGGVVIGVALRAATAPSPSPAPQDPAPAARAPDVRAATAPGSGSKRPELDLLVAPSPTPTSAGKTTGDPSGRPRDSEATLAQEVALLDAVRVALDGGRAAQAMELLDRYERDFPHGQLAPEALLFRVRTYGAAGNTSAASSLAAQLLAKTPDGRYADRVREAVSHLTSVPRSGQ
jgi:hypothetical protein